MPQKLMKLRLDILLQLQLVESVGECCLRRAFSIHKSTPGQTLEIIFAAHGQGTQWLATQSAGDVIDVIAPLGKPFVLPRQPIPA
jgi:NAD(P)H-flavin reductase